MSATTVRISKELHGILKEIAKQTNVSMQAVLVEAIEDYRRRLILNEANQAFLRVRESAGEWKDETQEREAWEATLGDDLEDEKP